MKSIIGTILIALLVTSCGSFRHDNFNKRKFLNLHAREQGINGRDASGENALAVTKNRPSVSQPNELRKIDETETKFEFHADALRATSDTLEKVAENEEDSIAKYRVINTQSSSRFATGTNQTDVTTDEPGDSDEERERIIKRKTKARNIFLIAAAICAAPALCLIIMLASQTSGAKIGTELEGIVYLMILLGLASIFVAWVLNWSVVKRTKKASTETPEQRQRRVTSRAFAFTWLAIMAVPVIIYLIMFVYLIVMYITW